MPSRSTSVKYRGKKAASAKINPLMSLYKPMFDRIDADGSGLIDALELMTAFQEMLPEDELALITPNQIAEMISSADMNGDGELDIHEFISVMEESKDTVSLWAKAHQSMWGRVGNQMNVAASVGDSMLKPVHGVVNMHSSGITAGGTKFRTPPAIFRLLAVFVSAAMIMPFSVMSTITLSFFSARFVKPEMFYACAAIFVFMILISLVLFIVAARRGQDPVMYLLGTHYRSQTTGKVCGFGTVLALYAIVCMGSICSFGIFSFANFWSPFFTEQGQSLSEKVQGVVLWVRE